MIVVSNTSPIMNLAVVGQLNILKQLYDKVLIPEGVFQELSAIGSEQAEVSMIQALSWIEMRTVVNRSLVDSLQLELDAGEAETIVLALEMKDELILIDERRARKIASRLGLRSMGLLGVLVEAKHRGLIPMVKPIFDEMIVKAGFWVSNQLYTRILQEVGEKPY